MGSRNRRRSRAFPEFRTFFWFFCGIKRGLPHHRKIRGTTEKSKCGIFAELILNHSSSRRYNQHKVLPRPPANVERIPSSRPRLCRLNCVRSALRAVLRFGRSLPYGKISLTAAFLVFASLWAAPAASADLGRPLTPEDILNLRWAARLAISPDGNRVAYLVVDPPPATDPGGHPIVGLWVAATDGATPPQRVAAGHSNVGSPRWSPSGSELAFLSDAAPPAAYMPGKQIWLLSNDLGRLLCLTRAPAGVSDFRWSHDGTEVAFTSPIADDNSPNGVKETGSPRRQRLWVASLPATKTHTEVRPTPVTPSDLHVIEFAWSPSGSQFAATVAPSGNLNESFEHARLVIVDRRSGSIQARHAEREGLRP